MIVKMSLEGASALSISKWIANKYPFNKTMWISYQTIQNFKNEALTMEKATLVAQQAEMEAFDAQEDKGIIPEENEAEIAAIVEMKTLDELGETKEEDDTYEIDVVAVEKATMVNKKPGRPKGGNKTARQKEVIAKLFDPKKLPATIKPLDYLPTYKEKIGEVKDNMTLDIPRKIAQLDKLMNSRMEHYFNSINDPGINNNADTIRANDKVFIEYLKQQRELFQDYKKFVEGVSQEGAEASVQLEIVQEQVSIIRETIRELLEQIDPNIAINFLDQLNIKLNAIEYRKEAPNFPQQSKKMDKKIQEMEYKISTNEKH